MLKIVTSKFMSAIVKSKRAINRKLQGTTIKGNKLNGQTRIMYRQWEPKLNKLDSSNKNSAAASNEKYTFVSYNILAQDLLVQHVHLYADIPSDILRWNYRQRRLKLEMDKLQPDIICLQEMQCNHLKRLVQEIRGKRQMEYIFKKKTGIGTDGCAIIYDRQKFKLIKDHVIEYYTDGTTNLNRLNIGLTAKFIVQGNPIKSFVVATTHLLYNPKREDVRIAQVDILLKELFHFAQDSNGMHLPIILCGDFNFTPHTEAFKLLISERKFTNCNCKEETFQMDAIDFGKNGASTFQDMWVTVDYVLKSKLTNNERTIEISNIYKLPTIDDCYRNGKIPNYALGSDHFALAMVFTIS